MGKELNFLPLKYKAMGKESNFLFSLKAQLSPTWGRSQSPESKLSFSTNSSLKCKAILPHNFTYPSHSICREGFVPIVQNLYKSFPTNKSLLFFFPSFFILCLFHFIPFFFLLFGKSILQVPDTGTRVLDNTRPFLRSSIVSFWITPAGSKEHKKSHFQAILVH